MVENFFRYFVLVDLGLALLPTLYWRCLYFVDDYLLFYWELTRFFDPDWIGLIKF